MRSATKILSIIIFLCIHDIIIAQKFRGGLMGGIAVSDINGINPRGNGFHKLGLTFGGLVNTDLNKKNTLQFEMNYVQCGSLQPPDSLNNGYYNISLSYFEIPIIIKHHVHFTVHKKPVDKFDLEFGVSFGRLLSQEVIGSTNYKIYGTSSLYNHTIGSLIIGADYNFSRNFYVCVRYGNSFIPAIKRNQLRFTTINYTFNKGNNLILSFSVKYVFGKKTEEEVLPKPKEEE